MAEMQPFNMQNHKFYVQEAVISAATAINTLLFAGSALEAKRKLTSREADKPAAIKSTLLTSSRDCAAIPWFVVCRLQIFCIWQQLRAWASEPWHAVGPRQCGLRDPLPANCTTFERLKSLRCSVVKRLIVTSAFHNRKWPLPRKCHAPDILNGSYSPLSAQVPHAIMLKHALNAFGY